MYLIDLILQINLTFVTFDFTYTDQMYFYISTHIFHFVSTV